MTPSPSTLDWRELELAQPRTWEELEALHKGDDEPVSALEFCFFSRGHPILLDTTRPIDWSSIDDVWIRGVLFKPKDDPTKLGHCGEWVNIGECKNGHKFARRLQCGREWCPECREDKHKERVAKWLWRIQQFGTMAYLVVTIPPGESRWRAEEPTELNRIRRAVTRKLKAMGFNRGLSRIHFFGDQNPGIYHPHINFLFEAGYLSTEQLEAIKHVILRALADDSPGWPAYLGDELDIHYQYTRNPKKMIRWLWYITKATFLDWTWNKELAMKLYRFHISQVWGKKEDWTNVFGTNEPVWELPKKDKKEFQGAESIAHNICPEVMKNGQICGEKVRWRKRGESEFGDIDYKPWIIRSWKLPYLGYKPLWGRYYIHSPPKRV